MSRLRLASCALVMVTVALGFLPSAFAYNTWFSYSGSWTNAYTIGNGSWEPICQNCNHATLDIAQPTGGGRLQMWDVNLYTSDGSLQFYLVKFIYTSGSPWWCFFNCDSGSIVITFYVDGNLLSSPSYTYPCVSTCEVDHLYLPQFTTSIGNHLVRMEINFSANVHGSTADYWYTEGWMLGWNGNYYGVHNPA